MNTLPRRTFLKTSTLSVAALSLPGRLWPQARGPSDEIRVGIVGFRGRGGDHLAAFATMKGVRVTALCDADETVLQAGMKKFNEQPPEPPAGGEKKRRTDYYSTGPVQGFTDIRKLLESKLVDAVSIATPNHWHALAAIWAVQAGLDVYVEKPVSHNVWEGRQLVKAARKYNRIVQAGTQCRSSAGLRECFAWLKEGQLGKITLARGLCYKPRGSIGKVSGPQPVPPGVNYDLWCGPAPMAPILRRQFHYDWHWIWDFGNGDLGNQGIHQMDIARWALGADELSRRVLSLGGRLGYVDDGQTPNTQLVWHEFAHTPPLLFEVRGLPRKAGDKQMDNYRGASIGVVIHCEGGYVVIPSYTSATAHDKTGQVLRKFSGGGDHYQNFIEAVRARNPGLLRADVLEGHLSSALCHTGNISYRLGREAAPEEIRDALKGLPDLAEAFGRMQEHLAANNVDLAVTQARLGPLLKMDPKTERFPGHAQANALLTREYRKPFVVPEEV